MLAAQLFHTTYLLDVATVGSGEMAFEPVPIPPDPGAESLRESERTADGRDVEVGACGEQHQVVAGAAMTERAGVTFGTGCR